MTACLCGGIRHHEGLTYQERICQILRQPWQAFRIGDLPPHIAVLLYVILAVDKTVVAENHLDGDRGAEQIPGETVRLILHHVIQAVFNPQALQDTHAEFLVMVMENMAELVCERKPYTVLWPLIRIVNKAHWGLTRQHIYQLDGEGIRYELVSFARAVERKKYNPEISRDVTKKISEVMEQFEERENMILI